jgi:hypothetical protein
VLSFLSFVRPLALARLHTAHATTVLLALLSSAAYRNVLPLLTYERAPLDGAEGAALWAKITLLALAAVALPLAEPRVPSDPLEVHRVFVFFDHHSLLAQDANAEATASPLSTLLFAFLDPLVRAAATHVQLDADADLPPLHAADRTAILAATVKRTVYDSMDVHVPVTLLRGLMSMFRWSIAAQAGVQVLEVCSRPVPRSMGHANACMSA